jgi:heme a synthase
MPEIEKQAPDPSRSSLSARRFALYAWFVLAYNLGVVLWGAYVRATGSGAGCGNRWPLCDGIATLRTPTAATLIEFTHRATSALDVLLVAALVVWAFRIFPQRHPARLGAVLSAAFLVTEALLGASLVLLDHVAGNTSPYRALSLSIHLLNTLTLLGCLALTAIWGAGRPEARGAPIGRGREARLAGTTLALFMLLGVSGAIAALGDTLFPVHSLSEGFSQDLNPAANIFLRLRLWHPVLAALTGLWMAGYGVFAINRRKDAQLVAGVVMLLIGVQLACGMANLFLLAPVWMQMVHLLIGDLLWISLVLLSARMVAPVEEKRAQRSHAPR